MGGLITYQDPTRRENIKGKLKAKPKKKKGKKQNGY